MYILADDVLGYCRIYVFVVTGSDASDVPELGWLDWIIELLVTLWIGLPFERKSVLPGLRQFFARSSLASLRFTFLEQNNSDCKLLHKYYRRNGTSCHYLLEISKGDFFPLFLYKNWQVKINRRFEV